MLKLFQLQTVKHSKWLKKNWQDSLENPKVFELFKNYKLLKKDI